MQKNSILFLTNAYPDFDSSCRGIFIKKMATLLCEDEYEISVVTPKIYRVSRYFEEKNRIKIYRFPFFSGNRLLIEYQKIPYLRMILYFIVGFFFTIYTALKHKCNLIHVHWAIPTGLIGVLAGTILRRPAIVTIHGSDFRMAIERNFFLKRIFLYVCKKAKRLTCVSEVLKKEIERLGIEKGKISIIPMGVDEDFLNAGRNRRENLAGGHLKILSNRKFLPIYNLPLLIRAIPMVLKEEPNVQFIIAGDGPERENLEKKAKDLEIGSSVRFLGWVLHEEMPRLLSEAEIYISTSLDDGTSVSLLEAMASGTFPIVTDISSNREWIIEGENGFLVPIDDEKLLAQKIIDAIRNEDLLKRSRGKNLSLIQSKAFWPVNIEKFKKIYMELLAFKN